jgi:hypothetical protein
MPIRPDPDPQPLLKDNRFRFSQYCRNLLYLRFEENEKILLKFNLPALISDLLAPSRVDERIRIRKNVLITWFLLAQTWL